MEGKTMAKENRMYFELKYQKRGIFNKLADVEENKSFNADKDFQYEDDDVKGFLEKILRIMQQMDKNNYHNMWFYVGQENEWFQKEFTKFVITQSPTDRDNKVFNVVVYESLNSREETKISKIELKKMVLDYWKNLKY